MAIAFVASSGASTATPSPLTSFTVTKPTGTATGDLMIAGVNIDTSASGLTITLTGWTLATVGSGNNPDGNPAGWKNASYYYRFAQAGDPSSWTGSVSGGGGNGLSIVCGTYSGVDSTTPFINNASSQGFTAGTTLATPSVSNTDAAAWWVGLWATGFSATTNTARNWSSVGAGTLRQHPAGDELMAAALADSNGTVAVASYSITGTLSASADERMAWLGILKPAVAASSPNVGLSVNYAAISRGSRW